MSRPRSIHSSTNATHALTLSEAIEGFEVRDSGMDVRFLEDVQKRQLCSVQLSAENLMQLRQAVLSVADDLLAWMFTDMLQVCSTYAASQLLGY